MDVGHTLQKIVIDATRIGVSTCWIGPGADHKSILHHLGERFNPEQDSIICVCAMGYRSWFTPMFIRFFNKQMHHRLPLSSLFFSDAETQTPLATDKEPFLQFGRTFEACQWAPSSYNGQTTRCVAVTNKESGKPTRFDFYAATASRYYAAIATGIWCANWEMGCQALWISGHFEVLSDEQRGMTEALELPAYDIS